MGLGVAKIEAPPITFIWLLANLSKRLSPKIYLLPDCQKFLTNFTTASNEVLNRIIKPTMVVPIRTIKAPNPVINELIDSQAFWPKLPALPSIVIEMKVNIAPTTTLG